MLATQGGANALSTNTKEIGEIYRKCCSKIRTRKISDTEMPMEAVGTQ